MEKAKTRVYHDGENGDIELTEEEFQEVVEVYRILLEWDKDLNRSKEKQENNPALKKTPPTT